MLFDTPTSTQLSQVIAQVTAPAFLLGAVAAFISVLTHLRRILGAYAAYYNVLRTHRSLEKDAPFSRPVQRAGSIHSHAILGGLHHHYVRV